MAVAAAVKCQTARPSRTGCAHQPEWLDPSLGRRNVRYAWVAVAGSPVPLFAEHKGTNRRVDLHLACPRRLTPASFPTRYPFPQGLDDPGGRAHPGLASLAPRVCLHGRNDGRRRGNEDPRLPGNHLRPMIQAPQLACPAGSHDNRSRWDTVASLRQLPQASPTHAKAALRWWLDEESPSKPSPLSLVWDSIHICAPFQSIVPNEL